MTALRASARVAAVSLAAAALGAGCGSDKPPTEQERARQTVDRFLSGVHDGKDDVACRQLSHRAQQGLPQLLVLLRPDRQSAVDVVTGSQECEHLVATLRRFLQHAGRFDDLGGDARDVAIAPGGRTATVRVHSGRLITTWPLEKQGDGWRISEVAIGTVKKTETEGAEGEGGEGEGGEPGEEEEGRGG
ncbi:MAG TPA: hypothetical protein VF549_09140 [Solirubrobacteraceae bacterium]|jgi:hypothetical protein